MTASDSVTSPPLARAISVLESTTVKLEDDYDHKPRSSRARTSTQKPKKLESEEELEEEDEDEGITRCVCAEDSQSSHSLIKEFKLNSAIIDEELAQALMIQCDTCKCWQHGPCVGLWGEKVFLCSPKFTPTHSHSLLRTLYLPASLLIGLSRSLLL